MTIIAHWWYFHNSLAEICLSGTWLGYKCFCLDVGCQCSPSPLYFAPLEAVGKWDGNKYSVNCTEKIQTAVLSFVLKRIQELYWLQKQFSVGAPLEMGFTENAGCGKSTQPTRGLRAPALPWTVFTYDSFHGSLTQCQHSTVVAAIKYLVVSIRTHVIQYQQSKTNTK